LVEYGDYECPHCAQAYSIIARVQKHFGKGLRFVFRNFPLNRMHPHAESAAETAEFAGAHGKFREIHDGLFEDKAKTLCLNDKKGRLSALRTLPTIWILRTPPVDTAVRNANSSST
jgi:protein-disulfide isomerase